MATRTAEGTLELDGYRPFPNLAWRNAIQTRFEIPAILRILGMLLESARAAGVPPSFCGVTCAPCRSRTRRSTL
jgi:hypothetical protein